MRRGRLTPEGLLLGLALSAPVSAAEVSLDYHRAKWDPIHFPPAIQTATDKQCLACHQEILERSPLTQAPAGVDTRDTLAWYQTLDTYAGGQESFHRRHMVTDYARRVMDMKCTSCHRGNDPRDETANSSATADPALIQRKMVGPQVCLMCHGKNNYQIMGLPSDWWESGKLFNNSCLTCHAGIRTNRHRVNFLRPEAIEQAAQETSDVCFGCHGGRSWYRIAYSYPRHAWPGMADQVPDWAKDRPTESEARFLVGLAPETPAQSEVSPTAEE